MIKYAAYGLTQITLHQLIQMDVKAEEYRDFFNHLKINETIEVFIKKQNDMTTKKREAVS